MTAISGATRIAAVLGWPIDHSRSPAMVNAAFAAAAIDAVMIPIGVPPESLPAAVAGLRAMRALGASVTMPHKLAMAALCDELAPAAAAIGAVNCVQIADGRVIGHNTDSAGFTDALHDAGALIAGGRCALLGAGGAARAIAHGLRAAGAAQITVVARSRAEWTPTVAWTRDSLAAAFASADLLVDCTSTGFADATEREFVDSLPLDALPSNARVATLVYHRRALLLARATDRGHATLDGAGMLVHQGARAFALWTGVAAPIDAMRAALAASLRG